MKVNKQNSQTTVLWHPNFRIVATLPDTKVIRTSFLVNSAAIGLLVTTLVVFTLRELELGEVIEQTATWDTRISENKPKYSQATKFQKEFSEAEKRLKAIDSFVTADLGASVFLQRLADTLPKFFTMDAIEVNGLGVRLKGTIAGSSNKATDVATAYVNQLKSDPILSSKMQSVMLNSISREPEANRMVFEIEMKLKPRVETEVKPKPRK